MRGNKIIRCVGGVEWGKSQKVKKRYIFAAISIVVCTSLVRQSVSAEPAATVGGCPDVRIVFARGSGGERWHDQNYLAYKNAIESKIKTTAVKYEFIDLDYPAIGIGDVKVLTGAYFGAGKAYEFGESVQAGIRSLAELINNDSCLNTRYVVGGYSQGAMVVSGALSRIKADRLVYAATFGDPKIYLPEGEGLIPAACKGENLSDYRMYVPDCRAYKGLLGAYMPYEPDVLVGKVGVWCNGRDVFCSSKHWDLSGVNDHIAYVSDDLYEDASRVIFDKICKAVGVENKFSSPHDTAIMIDSTASMESMIEKYKAEALRLAKETLDSGGRVALFDYRDLSDPYELNMHCDFEKCSLEMFEKGLDEIQVDGGGDNPESLLSASFHAMKTLKWKQGSTKSLVALTDADFLTPDRDGTSLDDVVNLSKMIDPVNFYIVTDAIHGSFYEKLAEATDGAVVTDFDKLNLLTDYIMERYDSLPRVEEESVVGVMTEEPPSLLVSDVYDDAAGVKVAFESTSDQTLVILNDAVLGVTEQKEIVITELNHAVNNKLSLVPIGEHVRGEAVEVMIDGFGGDGGVSGASGASEASGASGVEVDRLIPKVPNTGRKK